MFHSQEMTEIELVVPEKHILPVLGVLADNGVFHQTDTSSLSSDIGLESASDWRNRSAAYAALEHRLLTTMKILQIDEGNPPDNNKAKLSDIDELTRITDNLELETQAIVSELTKDEKELDRINQDIEQLQPIAEIGINLDLIQNQQYLLTIIGTMPLENVERLKSSLIRVPFVLEILKKYGEKAVVLLTSSKNNADILGRAARSAYLNALTLPEDYHGTPREILQALRNHARNLQQKIDDHKLNLSILKDAKQDEYRALVWQIRGSRLLTDAISRFGKYMYTYLVVGWVPSDKFSDISRILENISKEIIIESHIPERGNTKQSIPVELNNRGIFGAFQSLVTTYGKPRYEEIDPTILLTITFPLLFGMMFGDVGHGLVLLLLGLLIASKKVKALAGMAALGTVVAVCGGVAIIFGFLYGSVFGLEHLIHPLWMQPMENIMDILIITVVVGVFILNMAFLIHLINAWKIKDWGHFLLGGTGLAGLLFYWSMIGLAVSLFMSSLSIPTMPFVVLAIISAVLIMCSDLLEKVLHHERPLIEGGFVMYFIQVFFELFETMLSLFSNSLSFVRVGAFAVAHAGLSAVVFILAEMAGTPQNIGYWVAIVLGNLFIIGFEGMIVGIQTLRLEYYEFLSKFFTGGGKTFSPLSLHQIRDF